MNQESYLLVAYTLGAAALYAGFGGVLGSLIRLARRSPSGHERGILIWFALLFFLPATVFVLGNAPWPWWLRILVLAAGVAPAILAATAQRQAGNLFLLPFARRYFAGAMAITALWSFGVSWSLAAVVPAIVGVSALVAGLASLLTAIRAA
jgi:hypothetical protein